MKQSEPWKWTSWHISKNRQRKEKTMTETQRDRARQKARRAFHGAGCSSSVFCDVVIKNKLVLFAWLGCHSIDGHGLTRRKHGIEGKGAPAPPRGTQVYLKSGLRDAMCCLEPREGEGNGHRPGTPSPASVCSGQRIHAEWQMQHLDASPHTILGAASLHGWSSFRASASLFTERRPTK